MKYKIIKSFFASAFAVCILYGFIRNGYETAVSYASNLETAAQTQETANAEIENSTDSNDISQAAETSAPTLPEYLSKLTCGGCGRNCPLINPRCHNGARKADMAAQDYYAEYS